MELKDIVEKLRDCANEIEKFMGDSDEDMDSSSDDKEARKSAQKAALKKKMTE
jgi:hypothetical protein